MGRLGLLLQALPRTPKLQDRPSDLHSVVRLVTIWQPGLSEKPR